MTQIVEFFEAAGTFDLAPAEALAFFQAKGLKATFAWQDMLGDEHDVAFTVAKMMDTDLLATVQGKLEAAIASGSSLRDFKRELVPTLQAAGWWGKKDMVDPLTGAVVKAQLGSASRVETIFRTNIQSAYAAGRWEQIDANARAAPWLLYDAVDDFRTRPEHAAMDGTVLPVTDKWWKTHHPPNGWNCRCGVVQLSDAELAEYGLAPKRPPPSPLKKWRNPRTGDTHLIPEDLDPGWDHNPGLARVEQIKALAAEKAQALADGAQQLALAEAAKLQAQANAAYRAELKAAQAELDAHAADNTPFLANAIKAVQSSKGAAELNPKQILALAQEKAAKVKLSTQIHAYKKAVTEGKTPGATAQAAFDSLPDAEQAKVLADLELKTGAKAAKGELSKIAEGDADEYTTAAYHKLIQAGTIGPQDGMTPKARLELIKATATNNANNDLLDLVAKHPPGTPEYDAMKAASTAAGGQADTIKGVLAAKQAIAELEAAKAVKAAADLEAIAAGTHTPQAGIKQALLKKYQANQYAQTVPAAQLVDDIIAEAAAEQAKKEAASVLSGYKKKVLAGKIPSAKEQAAFDALTPDKQAAYLAKIDAEKAKLTQAPAAAATAPEAPATPATAPAPLTDAQKYKALIKEVNDPADVPDAMAQYKAASAAGKKQLLADLEAHLADHDVDPQEIYAGLQPAPTPKPTPLTDEQKYKILVNEMTGDPGDIEDALDEYVNASAAGKKMLLDILEQDVADDGTDVEQLYATIQGAPAGTPAPAPLHPSQVAPEPLKMANMVKTGSQKGSNTGGFYQDTTTGERYYIKEPASADIARNELLAAKLYEAAGVEVPELTLIEEGGITRLASKIVDGVAENAAALKAGKVAGVADNFVVDAWLGNWDVAGMGFDNLLVKGGRAVRVDVGGALRYRAQGGLKGSAWGDNVLELETLRNSGINPQTAAVFKKVTQADLVAGARKVAAMTDAKIDDLVDRFGPTNAADAAALKKTLKARRDDIKSKLLPQADDLSAHPKYKALVGKLTAKVETAKTHLDENLLTAIKGVASRASTGLEKKDLDRVKDVVALFEDLQTGAGAVLSEASRKALVEHYRPWVTALQEAVRPGAGKTTTWAGGHFEGAKGPLEMNHGIITQDMLDAMPAYDTTAAAEFMRGYSSVPANRMKMADKHGLEELEARAIYNYTGSAYHEMNRGLREGGKGTRHGFADAMAAATAGLEKLPQYPAGSALRRGVSSYGLSDAAAFIAAHSKPGNIVRWNAFTSTSYATPFGGDVAFTIKTARTHANVSKFSAIPSENEILLHAGSTFRVISAQQFGGKWQITVEEVVDADTPLNFAEQNGAPEAAGERARTAAEQQERAASEIDEAGYVVVGFIPVTPEEAASKPFIDENTPIVPGVDPWAKPQA